MKYKLVLGAFAILSISLTSFVLGSRAQKPIELNQRLSNKLACSVPVDDDGLPTVLSSELSTIQETIKNKKINDGDKNNGNNKKRAYGNLDKETKVKIKDFVKKWPLSAETKNLHQQLLSLSDQLEAATTTEERLNIRKEYFAVAKQLTSDKCYVQILKAISKKHADSTTIKPAFD